MRPYFSWNIGDPYRGRLKPVLPIPCAACRTNEDYRRIIKIFQHAIYLPLSLYEWEGILMTSSEYIIKRCDISGYLVWSHCSKHFVTGWRQASAMPRDPFSAFISNCSQSGCDGTETESRDVTACSIWHHIHLIIRPTLFEQFDISTKFAIIHTL